MPVAAKPAGWPSSISGSNAVTTIPARNPTALPASSGQVSSCDRQSRSPKRPLKSTRNRVISTLRQRFATSELRLVATALSFAAGASVQRGMHQPRLADGIAWSAQHRLGPDEMQPPSQVHPERGPSRHAAEGRLHEVARRGE